MKKDLPACPVEITMGLIGEKWKVLIIRDLLTGTKRFGELRKSVTGITQKVLTNNLRQMEASGLVKRKVYAEVPPRVEYSLTDTGLSFKPILDSMVKWGNEYRIKQKYMHQYHFFITITGTSISSFVNPQCVDFFTGFPSAKNVSILIMLPATDKAI